MTEATDDLLYFEDLEVGTAHQWGAYELTEEEIIEMGTRFDPQPWHLDHEAAKDSVFGELVACACHLQCVMSALHAQNPRPFAIAAGLGQKEGRFAAPGRIGDVLQLSARGPVEARVGVPPDDGDHRGRQHPARPGR